MLARLFHQLLPRPLELEKAFAVISSRVWLHDNLTRGFRQARGYEPEALLNFVALMGWSPQSSGSYTPSPAAAGAGNAADSAPPSDVANEEVLPLPALIEAFSLEGVNKNRATMQSAKLDFLNRAHLRIKLADTSAEGGRQDVAKRARAVVLDKWPELAERRPRTVEETYIARVADALKVSRSSSA